MPRAWATPLDKVWLQSGVLPREGLHGPRLEGSGLRQTFGTNRVPKGAPEDGQEAAAFPLLDFSLGLV